MSQRTNKSRKPHVVGLTGGMGTGKSTVLSMFRHEGVPTLDCDLFSHEALRESSIHQKILRRFGGVDKGVLAKRLTRPEDRLFLEKLIHPHVKRRMREAIAAFKERGRAGVVVEVPLLFEAAWEKEFDAILVVRVPRALALARVMKRDGLTREEALARMRLQMPLAEKARRADHVIDDSGTLAHTRRQVKRLIQAWW